MDITTINSLYVNGFLFKFIEFSFGRTNARLLLIKRCMAALRNLEKMGTMDKLRLETTPTAHCETDGRKNRVAET
jgi:hypothetical protein